MKPRVCLSVGNTNLNGLYAAIDYALSQAAEFVEIRFDMIYETADSANYGGDLSKNTVMASFIKEIGKIISYAKEKGIKLIGTNREASFGKQGFPETKDTGKQAKGALNEKEKPVRIKFLKSLIELGIDLCDIELDILERNVIKDFVSFAHSKNSRVILSVHDFKRSVALLDTVMYYIDSSYFGADYFKLADMAVSEGDAALVLEKNIKIHSIKTTGENAFPDFIIFGMGEKYEMTRALSVIYGSYLAYCSSPFGITAQGQTAPEDFYKTVSFLQQYKC